MSGSQDSLIYIWSLKSSKLVGVLGHKESGTGHMLEVNEVQWSGTD